MTNKRALEATRQILFRGGAEARPLHHVEAIKLAPRGERSAMIHNAARTLAAWPEPAEAAEEIVAAFFDEPPHRDESEPEPISMRVVRERAYRARLALRARHPEVFRGTPKPEPPEGYAPAPAPGKPTSDEDDGSAKIGPLPDDDRRDVSELAAAARVLAQAVQMNAELAEVVTGAADKLRGLALDHLAAELDDAVAAAGSLNPFGSTARTKEERDIVDTAMRSGRDPDKALNFAREWDQLAASSAGIRIGKRAYIDRNLERLEA